MKLINSVNDGGNTPLMVLQLIPPASVDYDNAASANTIDTPAYSVVQEANQRNWHLNHLNNKDKTAQQLLKDLMTSHPSEWEALKKIVKPDDI